MMKKIILYLTKWLVFVIWIFPVLAYSQNQIGSEEGLPWYLWIPLTVFGFLFSCLSRLLFSYWGWIIIIFVILPFVKDRLWMINRRKSFLHSQKSALINPRDADARYQLGMIYFKGKSYSRAEQYFREAVAITDDNSEYHFALARALYKRKKYLEAITAFQETLKINESTGYGEIQLGLGNCYLKMNKLPEAKQWFEKAIEENSSLAESYYKFALVCHRLGEAQKQDSLIKECREIASQSPPFLRSRNRIWGIYATFYPLSSIFVR